MDRATRIELIKQGLRRAVENGRVSGRRKQVSDDEIRGMAGLPIKEVRAKLGGRLSESRFRVRRRSLEQAQP